MSTENPLHCRGGKAALPRQEVQCLQQMGVFKIAFE